MADSSVSITSGAGTNIDTRTESTNGHHRQVMVIGDPSSNAGVAPVDAANGLGVQIIPELPAGNQNIGNVDIVTMPSVTIGSMPNVTIGAAIPAGTNNMGDVDIVTMPNVTLAAGTNTNEIVGDAAHDAAISGNPVIIGGVSSAAAPADVSADQEAVRAWRLRNGAAATVITAAGALIGGDATNGLDVDVTRVIPGVTATALGKAEDAVHTTADTGVMALGVANEANLQFGADADYVPIGTDREGSMRNIGSRAHDAVDAGAPIKVGLKAIAHGTNPTAVAAADRTDVYANRHGIPFSLGGHPNILTLEAEYTGAQTDAAIITVSAGTKIVVTQIHVTLGNDTTVNAGFRVGFGTANTPTTTGVVASHRKLAPGSGLAVGDGSGIIGIGADDADLRITSEVPTSGGLRVVVKYFTIES